MNKQSSNESGRSVEKHEIKVSEFIDKRNSSTTKRMTKKMSRKREDEKTY